MYYIGSHKIIVSEQELNASLCIPQTPISPTVLYVYHLTCRMYMGVLIGVLLDVCSIRILNEWCRRIHYIHSYYYSLFYLHLLCASIYVLIHYRLSTSCCNWFKVWDLVQSSKLWDSNYSLQNTLLQLQRNW